MHALVRRGLFLVVLAGCGSEEPVEATRTFTVTGTLEQPVLSLLFGSQEVGTPAEATATLQTIDDALPSDGVIGMTASIGSERVERDRCDTASVALSSFEDIQQLVLTCETGDTRLELTAHLEVATLDPIQLGSASDRHVAYVNGEIGGEPGLLTLEDVEATLE